MQFDDFIFALKNTVTCSGVECPKETTKCEVTSEAMASDRQKMKNIIECKDESDKVVKRGENIEPNPNPNDEPPYSRVATVSRNGDVEISDSRNYVMRVGGTKKLSKEEQEELNKNMRRMNHEFQSRMGEFQNNMNQMQQNMQRSFGNNFPFGNSNPFGENFPFGNSNPFGDNFPFGNNPFSNSRTFFYTPPVTNNFNGYVSGSFPSYPSYSSSYPPAYNPKQESRESDYAVEEFKPRVYQPTYNHYDKYRYSY
jgi:hypothetical protein